MILTIGIRALCLSLSEIWRKERLFPLDILCSQRAAAWHGPSIGMLLCVEPKDPKVPIEEKKDQMALAAIYQGVLEDMLFLVSEKENHAHGC